VINNLFFKIDFKFLFSLSFRPVYPVLSLRISVENLTTIFPPMKLEGNILINLRRNRPRWSGTLKKPT